MDCLFCNIASGKISTPLLHEDEDFVAFRDINPQAPVHVLLIPKLHIESLSDLDTSHTTLLGRLNMTAVKLSAELGLAGSGYRWVINCGLDGGQTVAHLHLHILGGRGMSWPPG